MSRRRATTIATTTGSALPAVSTPARVITLWVPGWSVTAVQRVRGISVGERLAIIDKGKVVACSHSAAQDGVTPGLKIREAQLRCPEILLEKFDADVEQRAFDPVLRAVQQVIPHVHQVRPGLLAVRALGATRFYGSEHAAAALLRDAVRELGLADVRTSGADGLFAAEQAAYATTVDHPWRVIDPGTTPAFLAPLPISSLTSTFGSEQPVKLLQRMGIRTIGALGALPGADVHARFGATGLHAHRIAHGGDTPSLRPHRIDNDLAAYAVIDPPALATEVIVHGCEPAIEQFAAALVAASLVCQEVRIVVTFESGDVDERVWRHPWPFLAADLLERLRWQLQDLVDGTRFDADGDESGPASFANASFGHDSFAHDSAVSVTITPVSTEPAAHHEQGLWGERPDIHVVHAVTGLQRRLGHGGVQSATLVGGRLLHQRIQLRPWGEAATPPAGRRLDQPWPGALPGLLPAVVHPSACPASVTTESHDPVQVDERGRLTGAPHWLTPAEGRRCQVTAWAGPWPVHQHWWRRGVRRISRFQVVSDACAWILLFDGRRWWTEARYE